MQISVRCKHCGFIYLDDKDNDLAIELDFSDEEIRYICRKCKKSNVVKLKSRGKETSQLPSILVG